MKEQGVGNGKRPYENQSISTRKVRTIHLVATLGQEDMVRSECEKRYADLEPQERYADLERKRRDADLEQRKRYADLKWKTRYTDPRAVFRTKSTAPSSLKRKWHT